MTVYNEMSVSDYVNELFVLIRLNFKGSELSKIERALGSWDDGIVHYALECFRLILINDESGFNERIIARAGMAACFAKQEKIERALSSLAIILDMLRDKFFLGNIYCFDHLKENDISSEDVSTAIEVFKKIIGIVEKLEIESEKTGENENKRVAGVIRISARINLAKLQIFQEMWRDSLENLLKVEKLADAKEDNFILLEIYNLIIKIYYNLEGEHSENAQKYHKKHLTALNIIATTR